MLKLLLCSEGRNSGEQLHSVVVDQKSEIPEIFEPDVFGLKLSPESALWFITLKETLKGEVNPFFFIPPLGQNWAN